MPTDPERTGSAPTVRIDAFGPLTATVDGCAVELGPRKRRLLLAVLLCHPGSEVPSGELVEALWGDHPPASAANNLRSYIFGLRRSLGAATIGGNGRPGYRLHAGALSTDLDRFRELCAEADDAAGRGDAQATRAALSSALELRRDRAFADVADAPAVADEADRLEERWLLAAEQRAELDLRLGRAAEVVAELTTLTARQPYRENLARLLMEALHRTDRRPEAVTVFRRTAAALRRDLDVAPGAALAGLHRAILRAGPELPEPGQPAPAELPPRSAHFAGRAAELGQLTEFVRHGRRQRVLPVVLITGPAGTGKTALAVHWGHRAGELFPDGQIFVALGGTAPEAAAHRILRSLGVTGEQLPDGPAESAALLRTLLAERRVLIVLDDLAPGRRIDELLPGGSGNAVVVTGRGPLAGPGGAHRLPLAPMPPGEAYGLLAGLIGRSRVETAPEAVRELARRCGGLPSELHAAATDLAGEPGLSVAGYLAGRRAAPEPGRIVWSAFDLSLRTLTGRERDLLVLLGLTPGRDLALPAAAALAGRPAADVDGDLRQLAGAGLLRRSGPGRYGFPEGFHAYVRDRLDAPAPAAQAAAIDRLYAHYADAADAADRVLHPGGLRLPMPGGAPAVLDEQAAREWFAAESATLVAACLREGPYALRVRIADALGGYLWTSRELDTWSLVARETNRAARAAGDLPAQTAAQIALAKIAECRCDYPRALSRLTDAVRLSREAGWRAAEAVALGSLAALEAEVGDSRRAARQFGAVLAISRETGSRLQEGRTLLHLGIHHREQGRLQPAYESLQQALSLITAESSLVGRAIIENNLAETCVLRGDFDEARERATEALRICRDVGHVSSTTSAYVMLSAAGRGRGDVRLAAHHAALALAVAARLDDAYLLGLAAHEAGQVHDALGEPGQAIEHHRTAYRMTARIRSRFLEIRHAIALAVAERRLALATGLPLNRPEVPDLRRALHQAHRAGYRGLEEAALAGLAEQN